MRQDKVSCLACQSEQDGWLAKSGVYRLISFHFSWEKGSTSISSHCFFGDWISESLEFTSALGDSLQRCMAQSAQRPSGTKSLRVSVGSQTATVLTERRQPSEAMKSNAKQWQCAEMSINHRLFFRCHEQMMYSCPVKVEGKVNGAAMWFMN